MAGWSSLAFRNIGKTNLMRSAFASSKNGLAPNCFNFVPVRNSGHGRTFMIRLSQYKFAKLRDLAHLYLMVGLIPVGALVLYCNIFIGPAKLAVIPEGYTPKHWEYYEHPITRWIAKMLPSPQEAYEKELHKIYANSMKTKISEVENKVEEFMKERQDYQAWYYMDPGVKFTRRMKEIHEEVQKQQNKGFGIVV